MGNLTKNISRYELACSCGCGFTSMDFETINIVQEACDHFAGEQGVGKVMLTINSAARCLTYNRKPVSKGGPGSNNKSQHPLANAMDFSISGVSPLEVYEYLNNKYPTQYGIGRYVEFTHFDSRNYKARW